MRSVAKHVQDERQCFYYAGLWKDNIWFDLLWYAKKPTAFGHQEYRAPSWSCASMGTGVNWPVQVDYYRQEAAVVSVDTIAAGEDLLGEIKAGTLIVKGLGLPGVIRRRVSTMADHRPDGLENDINQSSSLILQYDDQLLGSKWYQDYGYDDLGQGEVTVVILARLLHCAYGLVLAPDERNSHMFKRVGLAELWVADTPLKQTFPEQATEDDQYWPFERHHGSDKYRNFTII